MTPEDRFWNDPKVIRTFASLEAPPYWKDFFAGCEHPSAWQVLDLGCGGGRVTDMLMRMGFDTWACDAHEGMIAATRQRIASFTGTENARERIRRAAMTELPFPDGWFDAVVANGLYHNAATPEEFDDALRETARVLRAGGFLCLNVFYAGIVDADIRKDDLIPHRFFTREGLAMILFSDVIILEMLRQRGLAPHGEIARYESSVLTGRRSVLRGIFKKNAER